MQIQSTITELGTIITDLDLPNDFDELAVLEKRSTTFDDANISGITSVVYTAGFCLIKSCYDLQNQFSNIVTVDEDFVQLSILISGVSKISKEWIGTKKIIPRRVLQLAFRKDKNAHIELHSSTEKFEYVRIFMSRSYFLSLLEEEKWKHKDLLFRHVQDQKYVRFGDMVIPLSFNILEVIDEIVSNNYEGELAQFYLQNKLQELFLNIHFLGTSGVNTSTINSEEIKKIEAAKTHLDTHFVQPPTIKQLSRIVYLNELKLKEGFKERYGETIRTYVVQLRMKKAKKMLGKRTSVNEVAYKVGYKSVSYFIKTFQKTYGITPKQFVLQE